MQIVTQIVNYFLWYIFYSIAGWIMETLLFAVRDKKGVKRGFLFGPLCPIYGTGAVICTLLMYGKITNFFALFGLGLLLCDTVEYITHYVLEKAFHSKWWDYSNQKFNIKGRICLVSSILFGLGVAVLIKFIQPAVMTVTDMIPIKIRIIAALVVYSILLVDATLTIQSLKDVVNSLKEIQQYTVENWQQGIDKTDEKVDELVEKVKSIPSPDEISDKIKANKHIESLVERMRGDKSQLKKLKTIFPKLQFKNYKEALDIIFRQNKK
ncbi:MAG: hypothetical protein E7514_05390 [Ruminococcaceae bacterium]|nr:hypothetical protein [Oscillospiraceae bacterium]